MLRIVPSSCLDQAKNYLSKSDYYVEGGEQELAGQWRGKGARMLGLSGEVQKSDWHALCENIDPNTGKRLTVRQKSKRIIGYDWNFHSPKSVSLLYAETRDERILDAFRKSVDETMQDAEADMATRVRKGGKDENRKTGNMLLAEHVHFTSRPVNGVPDPHLHAHCFVFSATYDDVEKQFKAGQFRDLKRDGEFYAAMFHARFAYRLAQLGLPIERTKKGWELAGVNRALIDKFSRRTQQIEEKARELGITDADEKGALGAKTRKGKRKNLSLAELQDAWRERMTPKEIDVLETLAGKIGGVAAPRNGHASQRAMEYAIGHAFERRSVTPERELLAIALKQAVGQATVEQVLDRAARSELITGDRNGRRMATTRDVLKEERRVVEFAKAGRGTCAKLAAKDWKVKHDNLNASQRNAVRHILESRDSTILVRGAAGVGKTTLMKQAVEAIESNGRKVFAFAPSSDASRNTLRDAGFKDADTVAMLLKNERLHQQIAGHVIWIDEAGQLGMKTMAQLFALAKKLDARLLLTGDRRQHASVERGSPLRLLEDEAGIVTAEVKEIKRQTGEYKAAIKALSEGRVGEGFKRLDDLGWVREIADGERDRQLAADYVQSVAEVATALVVSPTHAEGNRITVAIRDALRKKGKLKAEERTFRVLEKSNLTEAERTDAVNYLPGDVLVFHQNAKNGFTRGDKLTVQHGKSLPLDQAARFQMFHATSLSLAPGDVIRITHNGQTADREKHRLENGSLYQIKSFDKNGDIVLKNGWRIDKDFGHLAYGYVVTSHASQSKTVDRVFVGQSSQSFPASSREQFYVSASRGRHRVTVYTDDKNALLEAIDQSDERMSATELVNGGLRMEMSRQAHEITADRQQQLGEETVYDR